MRMLKKKEKKKAANQLSWLKHGANKKEEKSQMNNLTFYLEILEEKKTKQT